MSLPDPGEGTGGGGIAPGGGGAGGGAPGMTTVLTTTVTLKEAGLVDVDGAAMQAFSAIPASWGFELWIDGTVVWNPSGTYPGDVIAIGGILHCEAGDRIVLLKWRGNSHVTLGPRYLKVRGFNNVEG